MIDLLNGLPILDCCLRFFAFIRGSMVSYADVRGILLNSLEILLALWNTAELIADSSSILSNRNELP